MIVIDVKEQVSGDFIRSQIVPNFWHYYEDTVGQGGVNYLANNYLLYTWADPCLAPIWRSSFFKI